MSLLLENSIPTNSLTKDLLQQQKKDHYHKHVKTFYTQHVR